MPHQKRNNLLASAKTFCNAFASQAPIYDILSCFSSRYQITAHEHGLQQVAPFLGKTFRGIHGIREYFTLLQKHLSYENMKFKNYIVDASENRVSVRGEASFTWKSTGQAWDEVFACQLAFDEDGKVVSYDVWADSGAAYLASQGYLTQQVTKEQEPPTGLQGKGTMYEPYDKGNQSDQAVGPGMEPSSGVS